jgi:multiple sugar transport system ATP-binding protein
VARVALEGVSKVYPGGVRAVDSATFEVGNEELVVLVGPSGCGKSTLLRMVAGLEAITDGTIRIGDRVVNEVPPKERDIAMVFQSYALYPHMSVYQNLAFGLSLRRVPKPDIDRRVREVADTLGLAPLLDRKPKALSGGQRQRVAVGRAIVRQPQVFLFDEPLSNLDAALRVQMRTEIHRLHEKLRATMIYVTHDQVEAMTMADRIVVLRAGVVEQVAPPLELYHRPVSRFVAGFIGSPAMNFLRGRLAAGARRFHADGLALELPPALAARLAPFDGTEIDLGIRPEDLHTTPPAADPLVLNTGVDLVEPMGAEAYVHVGLAGTTGLVRLTGDRLPAAGDALGLQVDPSRVHAFHAADGRRLASPERPEAAAGAASGLAVP